ncbi:hypothetical protein DC082_02630 [Ignatzschineria indica]|uniref:Uncharacterized protein n=1 Tax=Ignatzschineria indica TaxID=472583 RepID=A0A2U2AMT7_9GAMM|nr:hypothetical protein DC082_02630 [Ignatzschineria indica]
MGLIILITRDSLQEIIACIVSNTKYQYASKERIGRLMLDIRYHSLQSDSDNRLQHAQKGNRVK